MTVCKKCNGTGEITVPVEEHMGTVLYGTEQCDECDGTGEVQTNEEWIKSANTEQLAEVLSNIAYSSALRWNEVLGLSKEMETRKWTEWLKQPHTKE